MFAASATPSSSSSSERPSAVFGLPIHSYGLSKAAAALVAGYLLAREFRRPGWHPDRAWSIVVAATVVGFVGGKLYYLAERAGELTAHSFGPAGLTRSAA